MSVVRFKLPEDLVPQGGNVEVRVRVNGRDSNAVTIPVEKAN